MPRACLPPAIGIRTSSGQSRQVDECLCNFGKQFAKNDISRSCCLRLCLADSHDSGQHSALVRTHARSWQSFCKSRTQLLATAGATHCKAQLATFAVIVSFGQFCPPRYGIKNIRVLGASARAVVQDCVEAEDNTDARDKFFMHVLLGPDCEARSCFVVACLPGWLCQSLIPVPPLPQNRARRFCEPRRSV